MHRLLAWLLILGVLAGFGTRLLSQAGAFHVDVVVVDDCCHGHGDSPSEPADEDHGTDCPPGPHHHHHLGSCCGGLLATEEPEVCRLGVVPGLRTNWRHLDEAMPDGPVLGMDKPPLI